MAPTESVPKPTYKVGDVVLCFHHELLYEAKVLDTELNEDPSKDGLYSYRVHYKGWKATWDDWVPEKRLRKNNEENRQLQKDIVAQHQRPKASKKAHLDSSARASEDRHSSTPAAGRGTKRGRDYDIEKVGDYIPLGEHAFAPGSRPRGIWQVEKPDVVNQPLSWRSADTNSFTASKGWRKAEPVEQTRSSARQLREANPDLWNLLSKVHPGSSGRKYSRPYRKADWECGPAFKMQLSGIRLEPEESTSEPKKSKPKTSRAAPDQQDQPKKSLWPYDAMQNIDNTQENAVDALVHSTTDSSDLGPVSQDQRSKKCKASTVTSLRGEHQPRKARFLRTGARVEADGTVIHIPEWISALETARSRDVQNAALSSTSNDDEAATAKRTIRGDECPSPVQRTTPVPTTRATESKKPVLTDSKSRPSSLSSLSTPPASTPSSPFSSPKNQSYYDVLKVIVSEDFAAERSATPAGAPASMPPPASNATAAGPAEHDQASSQLLSGITSPPEIDAATTSLPTPRMSPAPTAEADSSSASMVSTRANTSPSDASSATTVEAITGTSGIVASVSLAIEVPSEGPRGSSGLRRSEREKKPTKRALESEDSYEENFIQRPTIKIPVPDSIKALLVDDWENVTKNLTLVPLPHPHPVSELLKKYLSEEQSKRKANTAEYDRVEEVTAGVKEYFDKCLGVMLLYKFERQQYKEVLAKTIDSGDVQWEAKTISDVYGAEHLCRLFVSFPELIAQTNMDQQSVTVLREELTKLTTWLGKHVEDWFMVDKYETPSKEYTDQARAL